MGLLALALICSDRGDEAIVQVTNALRLSPRDQATHWYLSMLSWVYLQQGQFDDCAREAQRSINAFSGWSPPWVTLGLARAALGQLDDALEAIKMGRQLDPFVTREGYRRYFDYVVRDARIRASIHDWLAAIWP